MKKRLIALILVCLMTSPIVTSCSNGDSKDETTPESSAADPTDATETAETETETETTIYDDLPTGSYDGHCFNMLNVVSNYAYVLLTAEDITGEPINDAVYNRNVAVGDKLNVSFSENIVGWNDIGPAITNMVMSDEYTYDIVFDESQSCIKYPAKKQVLNLYDIPGLNFEKPWWDACAIDTLSIGDSLYMANGDLHLMYGESAWVLFLNKNMLDKLKLESPYEIVKEGRWTYDKLYEMVSSAAVDLNGDGKMDSDDQYGLATHSDFSLVLLTSAGEQLISKNENNVPEFKELPEKVYDISKKVHDQFFDLNYVYQAYLTKSGVETSGIVPHFMEGKSLFLSEVLGHGKTLRDMDDDFGIIPSPKYDEAQESYHTFVARSAQAMMIPITNRDLERTGVIVENLGAESYKTVRPAYYDVQLSGKVARDKDSIEMLDIIFEGRRYEMAYIFGANQLGSTYITATANGTELASQVAKLSKVLKKTMDKQLGGIIAEE